MPRLTSLEKGGYYAFPDEYLPAVASLFAPAAEGGRLLDPCAGEGRALQHLSSSWHLTPYANELDLPSSVKSTFPHTTRMCWRAPWSGWSGTTCRAAR